jgi:hypothetical protein
MYKRIWFILCCLFHRAMSSRNYDNWVAVQRAMSSRNYDNWVAVQRALSSRNYDNWDSMSTWLTATTEKEHFKDCSTLGMTP